MQAERSLTGVFYDPRLLCHFNLDADDADHPESPERIRAIYNALKSAGLLERCYRITKLITRSSTETQLLRFHTQDYVDFIQSTAGMPASILTDYVPTLFNDVYFNGNTAYCASLSCAGLLALVDAVWDGQNCRNGFAIIRPPGHHAESDHAMGFCIYNNLVIAAKHLQLEHNVKRILIIDWDIHHGNGIQRAFYADPSVVYFSIHRHDNARFFPYSVEADYRKIGRDPARGRNINVPWPCDGFGDSDYRHVFQYILEPLIAEFRPEIILVACGFDAAAGDWVGGCRVSSKGFAEMTQRLMRSLDAVANGSKIVMALEGGYSLDALEESACEIVRALQEGSGSNIDSADPDDDTPSIECVHVVNSILRTLAPFWECFKQYQKNK